MKKKFDCVKMKRKNAQKIIDNISGLSRQEELKFWHESTGKLVNLKNAAKKQTYKETRPARGTAAVPLISG